MSSNMNTYKNLQYSLNLIDDDDDDDAQNVWHNAEFPDGLEGQVSCGKGLSMIFIVG